MSDRIQLTPDEGLLAQKLVGECDGQAEGYRLGMEQSKRMLLQLMVTLRQKPQPPAAPIPVPDEPPVASTEGEPNA